MNDIAITWKMGARVFLAYFWRHILLTFAFTLIFVLFFVMLGLVMPGLPENIVALLGNLLALPSLLLLQMKIFSIVFNKKYRHYTVALVDPQGVVLPRHIKYGLKLWWSMCWRMMVISLVLLTPVMIYVGLDLMPKLKQKALHTECTTIVEHYNQHKDSPENANDLRLMHEKYDTLHCAEVMQNAKTEEPSGDLFSISSKISLLVGMILGFFINFKIFEILLRKRYSNFAVRVTPKAIS